jgi:hypothetical protein
MTPFASSPKQVVDALQRELDAARADKARLRAALQAIADCRYDNTSAATLAQAAIKDTKP